METRDLKIGESTDSKTSKQGEADVSLLGAEKAQHFADAVGFVSDGKALEKHYDEPTEPITYLRPTYEEKHSIERYLSRPTLVSNVKWTGSIEDTVDVMETLRHHPNFNIFRQKLAGFYGFKATANLKVVVNAQPFHSGILQLSFHPFSDTRYRYSGYNRYALVQGNKDMLRSMFSGYPTTYLNVATQSDVTFSIPYCGQTPFMNLTNDKQDFGVFHIIDLLELKDSSNAPEIDISYYLYFTDVELFGSTALTRGGIATVRTALPQIEKAKKNVPQNRFTEMLPNIVINPPPTAKEGNRGLISEGARYLVGKIPFVGDFLQKGFDFLGLSKPVASQSPLFVTPLPSGNLVTYDSNINVVKFSAKSGQNTTIDQIGIDKDDEMEFSNIVAKPTGLAKFKWSAQDAPHKLLYSWPVEPQAHFRYLNKSTDAYVVQPPRLRYLANLFRYWRGTLRYTFMVAANKFHTGRLRFVYTIGGDPGNLSGDYSYSFNQIVDIRDGMTFSIDCPYFSDTPWRVIPHYFDGARAKYVQEDPVKRIVYDLLPCQMQVYVENTLRAGGQAAEEVELFIFVSGGPDFQLAGPIVPTSLPFPPFLKPSNERNDSGSSNKKALPQIEIDTGMNDIRVISMVHMGEDQMAKSPKACSETMGEEIGSLREVIKRYYPYTNGILPSKNCSIIGSPFATPAGNTTGPTVYRVNADPLRYVCEMYAFWRGGMRYNLACQNALVRVSFLPENTFLKNLKLGPSLNKLSPWKLIETDNVETLLSQLPVINQQPMDTNVTGSVNFEVPFYSKNTKILTVKQDDPLANHDGLVQNGCLPTGLVLGTITTNEPKPFTISRACADDFTFGYLIGVPPIITNIRKFTQ